MVMVVLKSGVADPLVMVGGWLPISLQDDSAWQAQSGVRSLSSPVFTVGLRDFGAGTQAPGLQACSGQGTRSRDTCHPPA